MSTITLLYPSGHKFDMDYYLSKHMKLIDEHWLPIGLQRWEVFQFPKDSPYQVQCTLHWESQSAYDAAAAGSGAKIIIGDVPQFTTAKPVRLQGNLKAASTTMKL